MTATSDTASMNKRKFKSKLTLSSVLLIVCIVSGNLLISSKLNKIVSHEGVILANSEGSDSKKVEYLSWSDVNEKIDGVLWMSYTTAFVSVLVVLVLAFGFVDPLVADFEENLSRTNSSNLKLKNSQRELRKALSRLVQMNRQLLNMQIELKGKNRKLVESERRIVSMSEEQLRTNKLLLEAQEMLLHN